MGAEEPQGGTREDAKNHTASTRRDFLKGVAASIGAGVLSASSTSLAAQNDKREMNDSEVIQVLGLLMVHIKKNRSDYLMDCVANSDNGKCDASQYGSDAVFEGQDFILKIFDTRKPYGPSNIPVSQITKKDKVIEIQMYDFSGDPNPKLIRIRPTPEDQGKMGLYKGIIKALII